MTADGIYMHVLLGKIKEEFSQGTIVHNRLHIGIYVFGTTVERSRKIKWTPKECGQYS